MTSDGVTFDYIAKEGKRRAITITDEAVTQTVRALADSGSTAEALFCYWTGGTWQPLRSHEVSSYIAGRAGGHFTAKEFRTWNATVLMALLLANAEPSPTARGRVKAIAAGVRGVADWLGDTPAVARSSYIDPRLISCYQSDGKLATIPRAPPCCRPRPKRRSPSPRSWPTRIGHSAEKHHIRASVVVTATHSARRRRQTAPARGRHDWVDGVIAALRCTPRAGGFR
jgi:hypothetical protein